MEGRRAGTHRRFAMTLVSLRPKGSPKGFWDAMNYDKIIKWEHV